MNPQKNKMTRLFVKQPFNEELEENKNKQEENEEHNKNKEIQENKEEQEKPLMDPTRYESEETHGGNETTNSIQNSPNQSEDNEEQKNNNKLNEQSKENEIKQDLNYTENNNSNEQSNNSNNTQSDEQNENNNSQNYLNNEQSNEENGINTNTQQFDNTEHNVNQRNNQNNDNNNQNTNNSNNEQNENNMQSSNSDQHANERNENNIFQETKGNAENNNNENEKQLPSGQYNTRQVVDLTSEISTYAKYYQTEFYRFIETFAEEKMKIFDNKHPEEYNIKKLMLRKYQKKPLNYYKGNKIKDTVILILDNSGSMDWWSKNLRILSLIALQRDDIQIYIAPNGDIQHMITKYSNYIPVYHPQVFKSLVNKKIIYVGDFDGADTPIELSWHNEVIWICPETRYRRFLSHDWVHYSEDKFNGVFIRAYNLDEMFQGLKKITRYFKLFIDFHINDEFQDD